MDDEGCVVLLISVQKNIPNSMEQSPSLEADSYSAG
jgi:hypothetical protein